MRTDQLEFAASCREMGMTWAAISAGFRERYGMNGLVAMRMAHGWSQRDAADQWNKLFPTDSKTFKNFSYWENWSGPAGFAPSLAVLSQLARLYECGVADLVSDVADHSNLDLNSEAAQYSQDHNLTPRAVSAAFDSVLTRLTDAPVEEITAAGLFWANHLGPQDDGYGLLMKISAGLGLAASALVGTAPVPAPRSNPAAHELVGIWRSRHRGDMEGDHIVVITGNRGRLMARSLPHPTGVKLRMSLEQEDNMVCGTWVERAPSGRVTHGVVRLQNTGNRRLLRGQWLGFGHQFHGFGGDWELIWHEQSANGSVLLTHRSKS